MAKDPAFLFYPGDWLGGTMGMTFEEKGAYFELLMLQFNRGHMTSHMIGQTIGQLWDKIKDKFLEDEHGLWYNKRLEVEKESRKTFTNSRNNNLLGHNQYTKSKDLKSGHMTSHMEDEDINRDEDKKIGKIVKKGKKKKDPNAEPYWKELVKVYYSFCFDKFNAKPTFDGSAPHDMHRIIEVLKERAIEAKIDWTEQIAKERWRGFLGWAFKDKWLSENWLLANLNSKKDKIFFSINGTYKQIPAGHHNGKEGTSEARTRVASGW